MILGGDGMFGHQLLRTLSPAHDVRVTLRGPLERYEEFELFTPANSIAGLDARDSDHLGDAIASFAPDAVVNCIGIVKQSALGQEALPSIQINSLEPHVAADACRANGARFIHLSTDCVFAGTRGNYKETDFPDCDDLYGRSKLLGEVVGARLLTLRTSMIGFELSRKTGLLEWILSRNGKQAKGFTRAIFSGFSTPELARIVERLLTSYPDAEGLYHVSAAAITKFDLLHLINDKMQLGIDIEPDETFRIDRSLDSTLFRARFDYSPPSWAAMVEELAEQYRGAGA